MQFILSSGNPFQDILWEKIDELNSTKFSTIDQRKDAQRKANNLELQTKAANSKGNTSIVDTNVQLLSHLRTRINHLIALEITIDNTVASMELCSTKEDLARAIDSVNRISNFVVEKYMKVTATQETPATQSMMDEMKMRIDGLLGKPAQVSTDTVRKELGLVTEGPSLREQIEAQFKGE